MLARGDAASAAERIESSIAFVGETVRGDHAVLSLRWKRPGRDILVDCALRRKAGAWRVYDVSLDGLSVIENYRAQFDHVIQRSSYQELLTRLEAKLSPPPLPSVASPPPRPAERRAPRLAESP